LLQSLAPILNLRRASILAPTRDKSKARTCKGRHRRGEGRNCRVEISLLTNFDRNDCKIQSLPCGFDISTLHGRCPTIRLEMTPHSHREIGQYSCPDRICVIAFPSLMVSVPPYATGACPRLVRTGVGRRRRWREEKTYRQVTCAIARTRPPVPLASSIKNRK
jgi:hypothetical protein